MSAIYYGGLKIQVVETQRWDRTPIYQAGWAYKYTRHVLRVRGIIDPSTTSYVPAGGGIPVFQRGVQGNQTDRLIRQFLMQPRLQLVFAVGEILANGTPTNVIDRNGGIQNSLALACPFGPSGGTEAAIRTPVINPVLTTVPGGSKPSSQQGKSGLYITDCNNGPIPLSCNVWRIVGTSNYGVEFEIQCDTNEWTTFFSKPPILLAQTWESNIEIDGDNGLSTRTINGEATFRRDVLEQQQVRPDDFRAILMHPIPPGFRRARLFVGQLDDGCTLKYRIIDQETDRGEYHRNIQRVQAWCEVGFDYVNVFGAAGHFTSLVGGWGQRGANISTRILGAGGKAAGAIGALAGVGAAVTATALAIMPSSSIRAVVRTHGNKRATIKYLRNVAERILFLRLGQPNFAFHSVVQHERYTWAGSRTAEVSWDIKISGPVNAYNALFKFDLPNQPVDGEGVGGALFRQMFPNARELNTVEVAGNNDDIAAGTLVLDGRTGPQAVLKGFTATVGAGASEGRNFGSYLQAAAAQALWFSTINPPAPPAPDPVNQQKTTLQY